MRHISLASLSSHSLTLVTIFFSSQKSLALSTLINNRKSPVSYLSILNSLLTSSPPQSPEFPDPSGVLEAYLDLKEYFSKTQVKSLLLHCSYDWARELVLGLVPPWGRLYSGSREENYRWIRPEGTDCRDPSPFLLSSGAGFFFVVKTSCFSHVYITTKNRFHSSPL